MKAKEGMLLARTPFSWHACKTCRRDQHVRTFAIAGLK